MTKIKLPYLLIAIFFVFSFASMATATTDNSVNLNDLTRSMELTATDISDDYTSETYTTTDPEKINELLEYGIATISMDGEVPSEVTITTIIENNITDFDSNDLNTRNILTVKITNVTYLGRKENVTGSIEHRAGNGPKKFTIGPFKVQNYCPSIPPKVSTGDISRAVGFNVNDKTTFNEKYTLEIPAGKKGSITAVGIYDGYSYTATASGYTPGSSLNGKAYKVVGISVTKNIY